MWDAMRLENICTHRPWTVTYEYTMLIPPDCYTRYVNCLFFFLLSELFHFSCLQSYVKSKATQILFKDMSNVILEDDDDLQIIEEEEIEETTSTKPKDAEYEELFKKMPTVTDE
jgi:hypothetical protein